MLRVSKRLVGIMSAVLLAGLVLTGCGSSAPTKSASTAPDSAPQSLDSLVKYAEGVTAKLSDDEIKAARQTVQDEVQKAFSVDYKTAPDKPAFLDLLTPEFQGPFMADYTKSVKLAKDSQNEQRVSSLIMGHVTVTSDTTMTILNEFVTNSSSKYGNRTHDMHGTFYMKKVNDKWLIDNIKFVESQPGQKPGQPQQGQPQQGQLQQGQPQQGQPQQGQPQTQPQTQPQK